MSWEPWGPEAFEQYFTDRRKAFPDMQYASEELVSEGETSAAVDVAGHPYRAIAESAYPAYRQTGDDDWISVDSWLTLFQSVILTIGN